MRTKTIYRIENKKQQGIFINTQNLSDKIKFNTGIYNRHSEFNSPYMDKLKLKIGRTPQYCAYKNLRQLKKWVKLWEIDYLNCLGFRIVKIKVKVYQEGQHQIMFARKDVLSKEIVILKSA